MDVIKKLQSAAELADGIGNVQLPDATGVETQCCSWGIVAQLKAHQAEGVAWLIRRYVRGVNVILGDEMGLGKTLQAITMLAYLSTQRRCPGPYLILCPLSVTDGWASELVRFAPKFKVLRYVGDKDQRQDFRKTICDYVTKQPSHCHSDPALPFDILLTTYEIAVIDAKFLSQIQWRYTIVDEAQRLKNSSTVLYQTLQEQFVIPRRLLLTGTPIQNNLEELWSLLHFCMPLVFHSMERFLDAFGKVALGDAKNLSALQQVDGAKGGSNRLETLKHIVTVFMLRRTKAALIKTNAISLPPLTEVTLMAPLVPLQRQVYISLLKKESPRLMATDSSKPVMALQNMVVQLRKACSHPYLFDGVEPEPFQEGEHVVQASGKLTVLDLLLKRLHLEGHHVLIFAQMTRTLDIIQDYLQFRKYPYERLDGSVRAEERFSAVSSFNKIRGTAATDGVSSKDDTHANGPFVFLLATRAGGVGLNLIAADTVIFFEQDWNPQVDRQALQRAHRIGQSRAVLVVNLITEKTIEEVIRDRARRKLQLTHEVIGSDNDGKEIHGPGLSVADLQSMVAFGLHETGCQTGPMGITIDQSPSERMFVSKMVSVVDKVLDQRGTKSVQYDYSVKDTDVTFFEGVSLDSQQGEYSVHAKSSDMITNCFKTEDLEILNSWKSEELEGAHDENTEPSGRKGRKRIAPVTEPTVKTKRNADEMKHKRWERLGYKSLSVGDPGINSEDLVNKDSGGSVQFVVGDCTKPIRTHTSDAAIIFSCVDDSGSWGSGGMFDALSCVSENISDAYMTAHAAGDLHLGDLHLVPIPSINSVASIEEIPRHQDKVTTWVALGVVQSFDGRRKPPRSEISLPELEGCIRTVAAAASESSASVHMPRFGARHGNGQKLWYAVERLLRKYAAVYGVQFLVYYFKRNTS